jgi:DNA-binding transcriptional MerR regulator
VTDRTQEAFPIDELAARTGMTARNIRAYQSRGLLQPPEVRGRTGFYYPEHVARIELIKELQAGGFNLEAIRHLIESSGGSSAEVLRFTRAVKEPWEDEQPEVVDAAQLDENFGDRREVLRRVEKLGLLRPLGDGRYEQVSPRLAHAGRELEALGIPLETGLDVVAHMRKHADGVAKRFVDLFVETVWKPFDEAGRPEERWPEVREALERLRPLAAQSLLAVFQLAMTDAVEREFGRRFSGS